MSTKDFQTKSPIRIFLSYFKNHKNLFIIDILCACLIAGIDLAFPLITRTALYDLLPNNLYGTFFTIIIAMVVCYLLRSLLQFIVAYYGHTFGIRVEADIRADLFRHIQTLGFDFYDRNRTGQLMSRLTSDLFELTELAHHGPEDIFLSVITLIGAAIMVATINIWLALIILVIVPIILLIAVKLRLELRNSFRVSRERTSEINSTVESSISGIRVAKAYTAEKHENEKFKDANVHLQDARSLQYKSMSKFHTAMSFSMDFLYSSYVVVPINFILPSALYFFIKFDSRKKSAE